MIIPVFRVYTTQFPIAATTTIEPGMVVALNSSGYAIPCDGDAGDNTALPIGISADRNRASEANEWVNRVSDSGNDTAASAKLSVYSYGEFYVDVDDSSITTPAGSDITGVLVSTATAAPGALLYLDDTAANSGKMDSTGSTTIGKFLSAAATLDSGIPGEYEPGSSVDYADDATPRTWVKIKLEV